MIKEGGSGIIESNLDTVIRKVTNGHALTKHLQEFTDPALGPVLDIKDQAGLEKHLRHVLNDPETIGMVRDVEGSYMSFYNKKTNTLFHFEPKNPDGGSIYRPKNPEKDFLAEFDKALKDPHSSKIIIEGGGYKALSEKFTALTGKIPVHRYWGQMSHELGKLGQIPVDLLREMKKDLKLKSAGLLPFEELAKESKLVRSFNVAAKVAPMVFRRGLKFIPLAGTAAVYFMGEAEAADMRDQAAAAAEAGILPPEALAEYETVVNAHRLQLNLDFSLVGAEGKVQLGFEKFAEKWGLNEHPEWKERLEPASLSEEITGLNMVSISGEELQTIWDSLPADISADMPPEMQALVQYKALEQRERFAEYYYDLKQHDSLRYVQEAVEDYAAQSPDGEPLPPEDSPVLLGAGPAGMNKIQPAMMTH